MNRLEKVREIRTALRSGSASIGSWMQIPDSNIAEIMGRAGYQWVAIDMEHGPVAVSQLPDIFELSNWAEHCLLHESLVRCRSIVVKH